MRSDDWPAVRAIYEQGIGTRNATFDEEAPSWAEWDDDHLGEPRLVAERDGEVIGWAALSPTSRRACYAGVAIYPRGTGHLFPVDRGMRDWNGGRLLIPLPASAGCS